MVTRRSWTARKDPRSDWISQIDLDGRMATRHDRALRHERCDLVDSVRDLFIRRVAIICDVVARQPAPSLTIGLLTLDAWPVFRASLRSERRRPLRSGF